MALTLGKQFDRNYNLRISFLNSYFNIYIFFNKKSPLVLYNVDQDRQSFIDKSINVKMFKNLTGSIFCETFLNLHNYRKNNLDIVNQFHEIKSEFSSDLIFICNESVNLSKIEINDKVLYDTITIYGFTLSSHVNEYAFILTERQNINQSLGKKIVRTTGLQLATNNSIDFINDFSNQIKKHGILGLDKKDQSKENINFSEIDKKD